ncbi:MAG: Asp-tRNA(Asn)/Glu-tRNA(Gln) amidotransferase subunit GatA [Planctomycetota bacterium]
MAIDLTQATMIGLRDAVASKQVSAVELTQAYLDRIAALDAELQSYHELHAERALQRAADVDAGSVTGELAGVPIAVKDLFCTEHGKTTASSRMLENYRSPFTATAVRRLEDAGAVVLGKTNMDEFAMGSSGETCAFGHAKNPWDTLRVPGGSSAGSAAAVAADLCAASLGSDTGGSIRQPAAFCGVVGLKPTYGRISRSGMVAFASSLDQCGPFTRTVADAALLTKIMSGLDPLDGTTAPIDVEPDFDDVEQAVPNLRIGVAKQYMLEGANEPAVQQATDDAIAFYREAGAEIVEVDLPHTKYGIPVYYVVATAECSSNLARYDGVHFGHRTAEPVADIVELFSKSRAEGFGDEVKRRVMLGTYALSAGYSDQYYNRALAVRRLIKQDFDQAFASCDAILCPTTTGPAFKFGDKADDPLAMYLNDVYTVNANLAGIAGISLPAGTMEVDGRPLPVGVQLLGDAFAEAKLLRIARMFEAAHEFSAMRPSL